MSLSVGPVGGVTPAYLPARIRLGGTLIDILRHTSHLNRYGPQVISGGVTLMKWIIGIIQPHRLEAVKQCLTEVEVFRLTVSDVQGYGRQKGHTEYFRGQPMQVNLIRKVRIDIAVNDNFVQP